MFRVQPSHPGPTLILLIQLFFFQYNLSGCESAELPRGNDRLKLKPFILCTTSHQVCRCTLLYAVMRASNLLPQMPHISASPFYKCDDVSIFWCPTFEVTLKLPKKHRQFVRSSSFWDDHHLFFLIHCKFSRLNPISELSQTFSSWQNDHQPGDGLHIVFHHITWSWKLT